ncbi:MAG: hypothetical protein AAF629_32600, partial [Chloroflexota bacterium]
MIESTQAQGFWGTFAQNFLDEYQAFQAESITALKRIYQKISWLQPTKHHPPCEGSLCPSQRKNLGHFV